MEKMKPYEETHQQGTIFLGNLEELGIAGQDMQIHGDLGVQIAEDGRVWVCINGIAFVRFSPHPNGKMSRD